jgi:glutathione synthase/RimK-type ligase-like ATP-grasp enzyme
MDFLIDKDGTPILCEVNSNAFFKGFEKVTGINVAKKYAEFIIKDLK